MEPLPAPGEPGGLRVARRRRLVHGRVRAVARDEPAGVVPPPAFFAAAEGAVREVLVQVERPLRRRVLAGRPFVEVDELAHIVGVDGCAHSVGARAEQAVEHFAHVSVSLHVEGWDSLDAGPVHPLDARLVLLGYAARVRKVAETRGHGLARGVGAVDAVHERSPRGAGEHEHRAAR